MRVLVLVAALGFASACGGASSTAWQVEDRLEATDGQTWVVGNHLVTVSPDAAVVGKPAVGATVHVSGQRTSRGELVVDSVEVKPQATTPKPRQPTPVPARDKKGGGRGEDHGEGGD